MFGRNFDKLETNSALKAVYRVKHHLKWLKIKCRFSELQGLSCRNNKVTACCSNCRRPSVWFERSHSAGQARCIAHDCSAPSTGCYVIQSKRIWRWYSVVLARPTSPAGIWNSVNGYFLDKLVLEKIDIKVFLQLSRCSLKYTQAKYTIESHYINWSIVQSIV